MSHPPRRLRHQRRRRHRGQRRRVLDRHRRPVLRLRLLGHPPPDSYEDGSDDDQSQGKIDLSPAGDSYRRYVSIDDWGDGLIGGPDDGNENAIVFGPRGFVTNPVTDFSGEGYIEVTFVNKYARGEGIVQDYVVKISRSGMARVDNSVQESYDNLWSGTATSSSTP